MFIALALALLSAPVLKDYSVIFKGCYDGDTCTFDVIIDDTTAQFGFGVTQRTITTRVGQKVRLCDINAPEMKPGPNPAAIKARDDLVNAIRGAKKVILKVPQKANCDGKSCDNFEKYGRLLGYIYADGVNLNRAQLMKDNAVPFMKCQ